MMEALLNWSPGGDTYTHSAHIHGHTLRPHLQTCSQHACKHVCVHTHTHLRPPEDTSIPRTSRCEQGREAEGSPLPGRGPNRTHVVCDAPSGRGRENISRRPGPDCRVEPPGAAVGSAPRGTQEPKHEDCSEFPAVQLDHCYTSMIHIRAALTLKT